MIEVQNCLICKHLVPKEFEVNTNIYSYIRVRLSCVVKPSLHDGLMSFPFTNEQKCCEPKGE